jgi:outer membrane lipoprotein-sorting protein
MLVASLVFAGALVAAAQEPAPSQAPPAVSADEVVAKTLAAKGGLEKLKALNSARISGRILDKGREAQMMVWSKRPNLMRKQILVDNQKIIDGFDGTVAWAMHPAFGVRTATGPEAEIVKGQAEFDNVFVDYKEKGHTVELVGTETLSGRPAYHLKLTRKNGQVQHHYIDVETGREVRVVTSVSRNGQTAEVVTDYADYREVDGMMVPFSLRQSVNGTQVSEVVFDAVAFNVPIDHTLFKVPARQ